MIFGKLKKNLNEKCPYCKNILQLRTFQSDRIVDGELVSLDEDTIVCSNQYCDYQRDVEEKRKRKKELKDNANAYKSFEKPKRFGNSFGKSG